MKYLVSFFDEDDWDLYVAQVEFEVNSLSELHSKSDDYASDILVPAGFNVGGYDMKKIEG